MLYLYCDESGKADSNDYVAMCGFAIDHRQLRQLSDVWIDYLGVERLPPIHMREIFHVGERLRPNRPDRWLQVKTRWGMRWEAKRDRMLEELAAIVQDSSARAIGTVIDARHFRSGTCPRLNQNYRGDAIHLAFARTVMPCVEGVAQGVPSPEIGIVVDDDKETSIHFHEWVNEIKHDSRNPSGTLIKSLCFADDKYFPLLQAADMLAFTARQRQIPGATVLPMIYEKLTKNFDSEPEVLDQSALDRLEAEERNA
jgi:hypothetical protein